MLEENEKLVQRVEELEAQVAALSANNAHKQSHKQHGAGRKSRRQRDESKAADGVNRPNIKQAHWYVNTSACST